MLTDDLMSRVADPAAAAPETSGEFALSDDLMLEAAGMDSGTPVFSAPTLDRIRACD